MNNEEFETLAKRHMDMVFRLAFNYMKSASDADDVTQNVLLRLLKNGKPFASGEHARYWLVRVTVNECRRALRSPWRRVGDIGEYAESLQFETPEHSELFYAVMELPEKYRTAIYLHYYEGYSTKEIAEIIGVPAATVRTRLRRAREQLKTGLKEAGSNV
ncbi:MAG: sigma-70 family RNA polymerase sigma factor [Candidatus Limivicinus sp.]|nr:sigma-70 family RNA polymerase sigma factor [Candidatus Limivicinus sp.]